MNSMKQQKATLMRPLIYILCALSMMLTASIGFADEATVTTSHSNPKNDAIAKLLQQAQKPADNASKHKQSSGDTNAPVSNKNSAFGDTAVSQSAFTRMVRNMMPLSPEQIKTLRLMFDQSQRAAATYPGTPPRPTSSSVVVNLSPGATPPIIRLRAGFVTSLVFLDSTGQPWPIAAYDLGDPKSFNIQWNKTGNTLMVQATSSYKSGNLAVMLKGYDTPVMITLMPGQNNIDYRVDLRVPGMGPNAKPMMDGLPPAANPKLVSFLDGVPPSGARAIIVEGDQQSQAWVYGGHLYLRTHDKVLSPGWLSSMSSPDGTYIYELPKTPIVLASAGGRTVHLVMKGL